MVLRKAFLSSSQDSGPCLRGGISLSPYGNSVRDSTCTPSRWTALSKPYNKYQKKSETSVLTINDGISYTPKYWYFVLISTRKPLVLPHIKDRSITQFLILAKHHSLLNRCVLLVSNENTQIHTHIEN